MLRDSNFLKIFWMHWQMRNFLKYQTWYQKRKRDDTGRSHRGTIGRSPPLCQSRSRPCQCQWSWLMDVRLWNNMTCHAFTQLMSKRYWRHNLLNNIFHNLSNMFFNNFVKLHIGGNSGRIRQKGTTKVGTESRIRVHCKF